MPPSDDPSRTTAAVGIGARLARGAGAALLGGLVLGALDALLAWRQLRALPASSVPELRLDGLQDLGLGALGAVALWSALLALPLIGASLLLGRWLRWRGLLATALGLGGFALAYWHTRELILPGQSATSPGRLAAAAGILTAGLALGWLVAGPLARLLEAPPEGSGRRRPLGTAAVALAALAAAGGAAHMWLARSSTQGLGAIGERNAEAPNVLLIVVDALRADALGVYGNAAAHTPVIDRLAAEGALFENALVQAPFTGASFGSFFTGKYPRRHGLLTMGPGARIEPGMNFARMLKSAPLESGGQLVDQDRVTASFMTGALSHGSGLMDGFDAYRELMMGHPLVTLADRWSVFRSKLVPLRAWSKLEGKLSDHLLSEDARDWLARRADRRFAMFLHLYSTHTPYDPPEPFRSEFVDPEYDGPFTSFYAEHRRAIERGDYVPDSADVRQIAALYAAGAAHADHQIGIVIDELERTGILDSTLVIVTSDHGEDLGAGAEFDPSTGATRAVGRWEHNHMYRSNLHVPLVLRWPAGIPAGVRVEAPVEGVDLLPTIAEACGIALPVNPGPTQAVDGRSLLPLVRGERDEHKPYTFAEDATFVSIADGRYMLTLERFAVKPDGWRIALEEGLGQIRFHDLEQHPSGEQDLFADIVRGGRPTVASPENRERVLREIERMHTALLEWNAGQPIDVEAIERSERDLETDANAARRERERLAALGYAEGWDDYQGDLRQRVLEERSKLEPR